MHTPTRQLVRTIAGFIHIHPISPPSYSPYAVPTIVPDVCFVCTSGGLEHRRWGEKRMKDEAKCTAAAA